jgi:hypothetical protein
MCCTSLVRKRGDFQIRFKPNSCIRFYYKMNINSLILDIQYIMKINLDSRWEEMSAQIYGK